MSRCRICTSNDIEALVEEVAEAMWLTQETADPANEWRPWEKAGPYWQRIMREYANATVKVLSAEHAAHQ
ncbi:hypothetical protein HNO88_002932 [Novosphingobium chloroacetimidivorans]|uniref:Uncharacterized protein n=1 Tax=Novosphingobium chloroacetimidivorans TaxID=1428314 RepID=A0A7W7KCC4_9SPHN|nr:hypothetical protein [Novosphingobium chloroacetimidivorans]MBB4859603.1 hypothetical protein [Novosphingobium chloroacetimidivorans]